MSVNLTEQEIKELKTRFSGFVINESIANDTIIHTLSSGRVVYGNVTVEGVLEIKSVTNFLCE